VGVAAERVQHRNHVVDVIVEIEWPLRQRHDAGVAPFGDVDVVIGQKGLDGAAQQGRKMPGQRRDDQQPRLRPARRMLEYAFEVRELAEGALPNAGDTHRHPLAANQRRGNPPIRAAVAAGRTLEQLRRRGHRFAKAGGVERIHRIFEQQPGGVGCGPRRIERGMAHFIEPIERRRRQ